VDGVRHPRMGTEESASASRMSEGPSAPGPGAELIRY
jgi:hypothetical protein